MFTMRKSLKFKLNIVACLMSGIIIGGMGMSTYAAEVVDTQIPEETALPAGAVSYTHLTPPTKLEV